MHGTALAGAGYTAAQAVLDADDRDYHYGMAPQILVGARLIGGHRASLDLTAREYYVSDVGGFGTRRRDVIFRGDAALARCGSTVSTPSRSSTCSPGATRPIPIWRD